MALDRSKLRDTLQSLASDVFDYWKARKLHGDGRPYAVAESSHSWGLGQLNVFSLSPGPSSNHEDLASQVFMKSQKARLKDIWQMILAEAECLDADGISMDLEFFNMGKMAARGEAPYPDDPQISLSFLGITFHRDGSSTHPMSADDLADRLIQITEDLTDAPACGDRTFEVNEALIPAQDAATAIRIYCALRGIDLEDCAKAGFPEQIRLHEVLDASGVLENLLSAEKA